jgi:hypothetical protein
VIIALRQTRAMFVDAYRDLAAGKLFWITLALSGLVVLAFASVGIDERGVSVLWFRLDFIQATSESLPAHLLYKQMFLSFGVPFWLGWVATILALISTAGIIPAFIAGGTIDLSVAKPIGRVRLLLTRYVTGLVFVALQVTVFAAACFMVIGVRGGDWEPRLFLAVPVVVLFFSYLYSFCALIGLLTRSTIAALLVTMLFWLAIIVLNRTDDVLTDFRTRAQIRLERTTLAVDNSEQAAREQLQRLTDTGQSLPPPESWAPGIADELEAANPFLAPARQRQTSAAESLASLRRWQGIIGAARGPLPKTADTLALLDRALLSLEDYEFLIQAQGNAEGRRRDRQDDEDNINPAEVARRALAEKRAQSTPFILGSSLGFEAVMLGIVCLIFTRRDF